MNRNVLLISAIAAGIAAPALAQTAAPQPAAPAAAPQQVKPEAVPAKIALIAFEQVVLATNEGMKIRDDRHMESCQTSEVWELKQS